VTVGLSSWNKDISAQDVDMLILPPTYDKRVPGLLLEVLLADLRTKVSCFAF